VKVRVAPQRRIAWLAEAPREGAVCAAVYVCSILALVLGPLGHGWGFVDLTVYRYGGQAVLDHASLYDLRFPGALAFTYPPLSALCFTVLTIARMAVVAPLLTALNFVLTPIMFGLALRLPPVSSWLTRNQAMRMALLASAVGIWLEPLWTTLRYGQINVLIVTLILFDLRRNDRSRWKGVSLGLAIGLKLTPVIFTAYLLVTRRYRAAAVSLMVFAGTIAIGFVAAGHDSSEYWGGAFMDPHRVGRIENAANQTLRGAYSRLLHSTNVGAIWLCTAAVVGVIGLTLAAIAGRKGDEAQGFSLCAITALLVSPISWSHHWVLALPALALFAYRAHVKRSRAGLASAGAMMAIGFSQMIWWVPVNTPRHSELHLHGLQLVYANAYVIVGVAVLIAQLVRMISTEQGAWCETLLGTEPSRKRLAPVMPLLPTTIRSASRSSATSRIASAGSPWRAYTLTSTPASRATVAAASSVASTSSRGLIAHWRSSGAWRRSSLKR
jgi:alpha-1,2-mannosyltransferase